MEEYTNDSESAHLMAEASRQLSGNAVVLNHLTAINHTPETIDCELTRGRYESKLFKTADSESGHNCPKTTTCI